MLRLSQKQSKEVMKKMEGQVKFFDTKKGYGFIAGDDGQDYFMHISQLPAGAELKQGDIVEFTPTQSKRGKQAQGITLKK